MLCPARSSIGIHSACFRTRSWYSSYCDHGHCQIEPVWSGLRFYSKRIGVCSLNLTWEFQILQKLVIVYFAPETIDNQDLRQCLTYFFPVYCYSAPANQRRMFEVCCRPLSVGRLLLSCSAQILLPTLQILKEEYNDTEDNANMVAPAQIALQLIDWTDPTRMV